MFMIAEILVGSTIYTRGVDIWAVGTILGEMMNGRPVFPGTSTMNQIERIIEVINMPSKQDIDAVGSPYASTMLGTYQLYLSTCYLIMLCPFITLYSFITLHP